MNSEKLTAIIEEQCKSKINNGSFAEAMVSLHGIVKRLKKSLLRFDQKMKGYYSEEASILAVESRTSSPLRIPRDKISLMHIQIKGLFPAGEGAGYAGGIMSAAIDGERCAEAAVKFVYH